MKYKFWIVLLGSAWVILWTQLVRAETLTIVIDNVKSSEGTVLIQVMDSEAQFKGTGQVAAFMKPAAAGEMRFTAADLPKGEYAFRIMHDENDNGKMDSNFVGMPTEPWAFSNNAVGNFGPAKWEDAKFHLEADTTQTISLIQ